MTLRKIIGALMLCSPFAAIAVTASIALGHWWAGPLLLLGCASLAAFISVATSLLLGDDE